MSRRTRSQRLVNERDITGENVDEYVNKCVRYFIYRSGSNEPIKKNEIKKNVLTNAGRSFDNIIQEASTILDKVYGFKLIACDETGYITVQNIDNFNEDHNIDEVPADINKVLIMLVLTNIFMSKNPVTEASMLLFLSTMGIITDSDRNIFGNVKDFINVSMVKQNYITVQTDRMSKEITYGWGPRAENTISKHKILNFVSKISGDRQPRSWTEHYEEANEQFNNAEEQQQNELNKK